MKPVLSAEVAENGEVFQRHVYSLAFDLETLQKFWDKAKKFRVLFTDEVQTFDDFCNVFLIRHGDIISSRGLFWVVDDFVGMFYITDMSIPSNANVHFTWFDRRLNGRQEITRQMISYVMETYQLNRLTATIPMYAVAKLFSFLKQVGFKPEGRMKMTHRYRGELHDSMIFGYVNPLLLKKEGENGSE